MHYSIDRQTFCGSVLALENYNNLEVDFNLHDQILKCINLDKIINIVSSRMHWVHERYKLKIYLKENINSICWIFFLNIGKLITNITSFFVQINQNDHTLELVLWVQQWVVATNLYMLFLNKLFFFSYFRTALWSEINNVNLNIVII